MVKIFINDIEIPEDDIIELPKTGGIINVNRGLTLPPQQLKLNNISDKYSDTNSNSPFFRTNWYKQPIKILDSDINLIVWEGIITNLENDIGQKIITLQMNNIIYSIGNINANFELINETPSNIIWHLLTEVCKINPRYLNQSSFLKANAFQENNGIKINCKYTIEDNVKVINVINELRRISQCDLYIENQILFMSQWEKYEGQVGTPINLDDLSDIKIKETFIENKYSGYKVAYKSGANVDYVENISNIDGEIFNAPSENKGDLAADFKILFVNQTSAQTCANLALDRYNVFSKEIQLSLNWDYVNLRMYSLLMLTFGNYVGEPLQVIEINKDIKNREVKIKCVMLNYPNTVFNFPTKKPETPIIRKILLENDNVYIYLTKDILNETNEIFYFNKNGGEFNLALREGISPIMSNYDHISEEGYYVYKFSGFLSNTLISVYAVSQNKYRTLSEKSNIKSFMSTSESSGEYHLVSGGLIYSLGGLKIDLTTNTFLNPLSIPVTAGRYGKIVNAEWDDAEWSESKWSLDKYPWFDNKYAGKYDFSTYALFNNVYQSCIYNLIKKTSFIFKNKSNDSYIFFRTKNNNEWGIWNKIKLNIGLNYIATESNSIQFRIHINSYDVNENIVSLINIKEVE